MYPSTSQTRDRTSNRSEPDWLEEEPGSSGRAHKTHRPSCHHAFYSLISSLRLNLSSSLTQSNPPSSSAKSFTAPSQASTTQQGPPFSQGTRKCPDHAHLLPLASLPLVVSVTTSTLREESQRSPRSSSRVSSFTPTCLWCRFKLPFLNTVSCRRANTIRA